MFERFTDRARRTLVLAQEESKALGHNFIGTEHVLLGLAGEGEGVAAVALGALGVDAATIRREVALRVPSQWRQPAVAEALATVGIDLERVRREVEGTFGEGALALGTQAPFTPKAKDVLVASLSEAVALGHDYIGTEHLLLGLTAGETGLALEILSDFGTDAEAVRRMTLAVMTSAGHLVREPTLIDVRAIEDAVRVLPAAVKDAAKAVLRTSLYPVRGAAFVAIASDESEETVREQVALVAAALDATKLQLDELGVGAFIRLARLIRDHPVATGQSNLERALNMLVTGLQAERFTPNQVSVAAGVRKRSAAITETMWQAVWDDRDATDEAVAIDHLIRANGQLSELLAELASFAARSLLGLDEQPSDESAESS